MASISSLSDACEALLLDASVVVNLNATGYSAQILSALPFKVLVPRPVIRELRNGAANGHADATDLDALIGQSIVQEAPVVGAAQGEFIALTSGASVSSLGDGEAATIACAFSSGAWAAIDERKARRICAERYQTVKVVSTVDILAYDSVGEVLTEDEMAKSVFAALEVANMHVHAQHLDWVVSWIDDVQLERCRSLPRSVRERQMRVAKTAG
ncbi:MAG: hypothetical protein AAF850_00030 [Pseudomonadota bacterium]